MLPRPILSLSLAFIASACACAAEDPVAQFEREVKPILEERCFDCHGPKKQKGGLRLDQKAGMLSGGDSGEPAVRPGRSGESPLLKLVSSLEKDEMMPPKGERLKPEQVLALKKWIDDGAHLPMEPAAPEEEIEPTKGMAVTDEDRRFWAFRAPVRHTPKLAAESAWPQQPLDHFILARLQRQGLAPSAEAAPAMLLRRVTYDLTGLPPTPEEVEHFLRESAADAFAYDRAVERLLASPAFGERMASMWLPLARYAEDQAHQVGADTKYFYPNAHLYRAWVIDAFNRDLPYDRFLQLQLAADSVPGAEPADLAALGFLGLGPKYYNRDTLEVMADEWEDRVDTVTRTMLGLTVACARCHDHKFDPIPARDYHALAGVFASTKMVNKAPDGQVQKGEAKEMDPATLHMVEDGTVQDLNLFIRGNVKRKGEVVPRHFLTVLTPGEPAPFTEGSGRRELAAAIVSRENPLTARVFVNRVWGAFFGRPLVATPSNFGKSGGTPSHPELLDDLAARFMENGWSMKALVREIVLSSAYRQDSASDEAKAGIDPENEALWRMNRRRLSIEQWRDTVLATSGDLAEVGRGKSQELSDPENRRRTVYARISRLKLNDLLMQWDYPDANVHSEKRAVTVTPIQKLFVMNSVFIQRHAGLLVSRVLRSSEAEADRVSTAYRMLFAREPDDNETALALEFLSKPSASEMSRWEQYAQLLLASNELLYVD